MKRRYRITIFPDQKEAFEPGIFPFLWSMLYWNELSVVVLSPDKMCMGYQIDQHNKKPLDHTTVGP